VLGPNCRLCVHLPASFRWSDLGWCMASQCHAPVYRDGPAFPGRFRWPDTACWQSSHTLTAGDKTLLLKAAQSLAESGMGDTQVLSQCGFGGQLVPGLIPPTDQLGEGSFGSNVQRTGIYFYLHPAAPPKGIQDVRRLTSRGHTGRGATGAILSDVRSSLAQYQQCVKSPNELWRGCGPTATVELGRHAEA
jgi:hypothetical protein